MTTAKKQNTSCFISFTEDVSHIPLPEKLNFPFYYNVHPLCEIAAKQVQLFLEKNENLNHNFGLNNHSELAPIGKMFGVLVVQKDDEIGFLAAYSGKLANSNSVAFFVPPVFDMLKNDGYFLKEEEKLNALNRQIDAFENNEELQLLKKQLVAIKNAAQTEIEAYKKQMKLHKEQRKQKRIAYKETATAEEFQLIEADLIKQSLHEKHLLRVLTANYQSKENEISNQIAGFQDKINHLKEQRKAQSNALQHWLFNNYTFLNAHNKEKSLVAIFKTALHSQPPAGAGECCAPKLFQYAFQHQLKPIALAEFWWGVPPKSEVRKHKQFYPSCWGKCEPILAHMMQGLKVEENPFLQNPAAGKELEIVYDDAYLVIVNKPAEFLSVPGINISDSVYERIKKRYPQATGPLIVHRLDMSTSGLMVLAKNKEIHENLQKQFIKRRVKKSYIALLDGVVQNKSGTIELPLRVDLDDRPRQVVCFDYGKMGVTTFKVLEQNEKTTRIQYVPITGRTHQLRVHSAHNLGLNAPIKGDDLYGTKADRLYLHANMLEFHHPVRNEKMCFELPPDF
ncbi:RluA family pseudouridine synthase [Paenimyroides aestuarii]|uniref:Pseudouridine synthase n=1 Tax=Paenimyroides aestuarii TaxID=2968490 RepID=A0ABY5NRB3_9FLAO|nr:pseudouridine synthase [Paenimyroides aestuarii]UUV20998.1 pseudouridine synthase [Paenimyroides aestuarii]